MKQSRGEKLFHVANIIVLGVVALICLYPFLYTLSLSLSSAREASRDGLHLYPAELSLTSYLVVP